MTPVKPSHLRNGLSGAKFRRFYTSNVRGSVAEWLRGWTCDQQVSGSNPGRRAVPLQPWARCSHARASFTEQLGILSVPANGRLGR